MSEKWTQQGSLVVSCGSQGQHPDSPCRHEISWGSLLQVNLLRTLGHSPGLRSGGSQRACFGPREGP